MPNGLKTALLLGALSGLLLLLGEALGGSQGLMVGFVLAAVMNFGSYWFSDKIVLAMYGAKEVGAGHPLYRITANLAQRGGLPMPRVYVIQQDSPNAFATGRNPDHAAVAATEGIMRILDEHELEGVIGHLCDGIGDTRERAAARPAMIVHDDGEMFGKSGDVCVPEPTIATQPRDQEQGRSIAVLLVVELGAVAELDLWHCIPFRRYSVGGRLSG